MPPSPAPLSTVQQINPIDKLVKIENPISSRNASLSNRCEISELNIPKKDISQDTNLVANSVKEKIMMFQKNAAANKANNLNRQTTNSINSNITIKRVIMNKILSPVMEVAKKNISLTSATIKTAEKKISTSSTSNFGSKAIHTEPIVVKSNVPSPVTDTNYIPRQKLIINEEQAVINPLGKKNYNLKTSQIKEPKKLLPAAALNLNLNQILGKNSQKDSNQQKAAKVQYLSIAQNNMKEKSNFFAAKQPPTNPEPSSVVAVKHQEIELTKAIGEDSKACERCQDGEEKDDLKTFKSVREKIAYFSGRLLKEKSVTTANLSQNFSRRGINYQSQNNLSSFVNPSFSSNSSFRLSLANQIEKVNSVRMTHSINNLHNRKNFSSMNTMNTAHEYDSLNFAFKSSSSLLEDINNSTSK